MIERVGNEVNERHEHPERADQAGGIEDDEPSRCYRFAQRGPCRPNRLGARLCRIAVGTHGAIARIVLDQESHSTSHDGGKAAEDEVGFAPPQRFDQKRGERRHDERADTDAAHRETGGKSTTSDEPPLHRAHGGNIGAADAESDAYAVGGVDFGEAASRACDRQARPGEDHADDGQAAGAPAVGKRTAHDPEPEVQKAGEREHERDRAARGCEILLQGFDEGAERVGAPEADEGNGKRRGDHKPAVEDARIGRR